MSQREGGQQSRKVSSHGHPFLKGLLTGLVLGVALSAGVALYVTHMPSPFVAHSGQSSTAPDRPVAEMPDISRHGLMNPSPVNSEPVAAIQPANSPEAASLSPLQGPNVPAPAAVAVPVPVPGSGIPVSPPKEPGIGTPTTSYFLQTGAFAKESEADNQRAHLALLGIDGTVLSPEAGDRQALYRVRIGPIAAIDEVRTLMATLKNNGLSANVVKVVTVKPKDSAVR